MSKVAGRRLLEFGLIVSQFGFCQPRIKRQNCLGPHLNLVYLRLDLCSIGEIGLGQHSGKIVEMVINLKSVHANNIILW